MLEFILKCQSVDQPFVFVNFVFGLVDGMELKLSKNYIIIRSLRRKKIESIMALKIVFVFFLNRIISLNPSEISKYIFNIL